MNKKVVANRLLKLLFLLLMVLLYLVIYLIPSIESINLRKRKINDLKFKNTSLLGINNEIIYPDKFELQIMAEMDKKILEKIPLVKDESDWQKYQREVSDQLKNLSLKDGIRSLKVYQNNGVLFPGFSFGNSTAEKKMQLFSLAKLPAFNRSSPTELEWTSMYDDLASSSLCLVFSASLEEATNFINHLPWCGFYLMLEQINITYEEFNPYFIIQSRIFYFDKKITHEE